MIIMLDLTDRPSAPDFGRFGSTEATIAATKRPKSARKPSRCSSRLRWKTHETFKVSKMLLTPNPTTNWIRSRFVQNDNGERATCREGGCVPFSVCDNPDIASRPTYESTLNKISDHATKDRLPYDNWDFVEVNDTAVYNRFDGALHLVWDCGQGRMTRPVRRLPWWLCCRLFRYTYKKARPEAAPIQP